MKHRRREFSAKTREQAYERCKDKADVPRCEECGADLRNRRKRFDHRIRDVDGGDNTLANCQVLCEDRCDKAKTGKEQREHLKSVRVRRAYNGTKKPPLRQLKSRGFFLVVVHKPHMTATPAKFASLPRPRLFR